MRKAACETLSMHQPSSPLSSLTRSHFANATAPENSAGKRPVLNVMAKSATGAITKAARMRLSS